MNTLALLVLLAGLGSAPSTDAPSNHNVVSSDTVTVAVSVNGVQGDGGQIVVALFSTADGFPRDVTKAAYIASAPIQGDTTSIRVEGVEAGRYAVMAFHDADSNEEVDTNWIGMPKEGVAASNWTGRRPRFDDSALQITAGTPTVDLTLRYR
jgi:uncharacterized protein (DUF2141 family)